MALVYHGLAERLFKKRHAIRAYPTRATVNMHGPRYVTMRPRGRNRINLGAEITTVISSEHDDLAKAADKAFTDAMNRAPRRKTSMIRPRS